MFISWSTVQDRVCRRWRPSFGSCEGWDGSFLCWHWHFCPHGWCGHPWGRRTTGEKPKGLAAVLARCHSTSSDCALTQTEKIQQEISQYCSHPKLAINESPLLWWKVEHARFPNLASLARKYLCVCATSMPSEKVFSCSGHIVSDERSMLKPESVEQLVFLARNLSWA